MVLVRHLAQHTTLPFAQQHFTQIGLDDRRDAQVCAQRRRCLDSASQVSYIDR